MKRIIEVAGNIAILVVALLLCWKLVEATRGHASGTSASASDETLIGATLPLRSSYKWSDSPETLVFAIRAGCHFCEDSVPFYRRFAIA